MNTINLETEVIRENTKVLASEQVHLNEQAKLDAEVNKILANADAAYREGLMNELGFDYKIAEASKIKTARAEFAHLPQNRILGTNAIKAVCLKYGLRFLPTRYYKGALDEGIGAKLEEFKALNNGKLPTVYEGELCRGSANYNKGKTQFYIAAPSESFVLQPEPRDPLLFCRLSENKFFLLHKWGKDLEGVPKKHDITEGNWNSVFSSAVSNVREDISGVVNILIPDTNWRNSEVQSPYSGSSLSLAGLQNPYTFSATGLEGILGISGLSTTTAGLLGPSKW